MTGTDEHQTELIAALLDHSAAQTTVIREYKRWCDEGKLIPNPINSTSEDNEAFLGLFITMVELGEAVNALIEVKS